MSKLLVLFISLLFSCSGGDKKKVITLKEGEIPLSVSKLLSLKDYRSDEYKITSFEAALDLLNISKVHLRAENPAEALKYLAVAVKLFPYRGDISSSYKAAINQYVRNTNKLMSNKTITCNEYKDRYNYLLKTSPGSLTKLKRKVGNCTAKSIKSKGFNIANVLKEKSPKKYEIKEVKGINISEEIKEDERAFKNYMSYLPKENLINLLLDIYGDINFNPVKIFPSRDKKKISIKFDIDATRRYTSEEACEKLANITDRQVPKSISNPSKRSISNCIKAYRDFSALSIFAQNFLVNQLPVYYSYDVIFSKSNGESIVKKKLVSCSRMSIFQDGSGFACWETRELKSSFAKFKRIKKRYLANKRRGVREYGSTEKEVYYYMVPDKFLTNGFWKKYSSDFSLGFNLSSLDAVSTKVDFTFKNKYLLKELKSISLRLNKADTLDLFP